MKKCPRCNKLKLLTEFNKNCSELSGLQVYCRTCTREVTSSWYRRIGKLVRQKAHKENPKKHRQEQRDNCLKRKYGLTEIDYQNMLAVQAGKCCICGEIMALPFIDHCHKTGKVRGLLCQLCNLFLGSARESINNLRSAICYLAKHETEKQQIKTER